MKHDANGDPHVKAGSHKECVDAVHEHFLSYDFEIRDGQPFDGGHDDGGHGGFACFSNVEICYGKISGYSHCDGDGPVANIVESV